MFRPKSRIKRRRSRRSRFAPPQQVVQAMNFMYAKILFVVQAVGTFCRKDVDGEDNDEYSPGEFLIQSHFRCVCKWKSAFDQKYLFSC